MHAEHYKRCSCCGSSSSSVDFCRGLQHNREFQHIHAVNGWWDKIISKHWSGPHRVQEIHKVKEEGVSLDILQRLALCKGLSAVHVQDMQLLVAGHVPAFLQHTDMLLSKTAAAQAPALDTAI